MYVKFVLHIHPGQVYYQSFWMKWFRHPTPKRTTVYSSSPLIKELDMGPLTRNHLTPEVQTTDRYQNGSGKARFKGNKNLKGTQCLDLEKFTL